MTALSFASAERSAAIRNIKLWVTFPFERIADTRLLIRKIKRYRPLVKFAARTFFRPVQTLSLISATSYQSSQAKVYAKLE